MYPYYDPDIPQFFKGNDSICSHKTYVQILITVLFANQLPSTGDV